MTKLNKQDVFDLVYGYYAKGGTPGYDSKMEQCAYFGQDGGHCAIGVVLDSLGYERKNLSQYALEGNWKGVIQHLGTRFTDNFEENIYLIDQDQKVSTNESFFGRMQQAHDRVAEDSFEWDENDTENSHWHENTRDLLVESFKTFAKAEGLTLPK